MKAQVKEVRAISKNLRGSAQKLRIVVDQVRGKRVLYAMDLLEYMPKKAAGYVLKTLKSAVANAVENEKWNAEELIITRILADEAPTYKRFRAESKGRARQILKRNANLSIYIARESDLKSTPKAEEKKEVAKPAKSTTTKSVEAKPATKSSTKKQTNTEKKEKAPKKTAAKSATTKKKPAAKAKKVT